MGAAFSGSWGSGPSNNIRGYNMNNTNTLLIRRIIAIILLGCSIIFLFAPSMLTVYGSGASFSELRSSETSSIGMYFEYASYSPLLVVMGIMGILLNVCFFGLILFSVLGIILMLLNKTKAANIWHTVLAFLTVALFVGYMIIVKEESGIKTGPGAALFLLPIFSLAASILYQQDRSYSTPFPQHVAAPQQTPQYAYQPQQRPVQTNSWSCPNCGTQNADEARFCAACGTSKPVAAPAAPAAQFCPNCGAPQDPGASFCQNCGTRLN